MNAKPLDVILAGRTEYRAALEWQRSLAHDRIAGRLPHDVLLLLEHDPVVTLGRTARGENLLSDDGIDVVEVERGGDVTFHGPGQLVGYPILDLTGYRPDLHWYLRTLEQALIGALQARYGSDPKAARAPFDAAYAAEMAKVAASTATTPAMAVTTSSGPSRSCSSESAYSASPSSITCIASAGRSSRSASSATAPR